MEFKVNDRVRHKQTGEFGVIKAYSIRMKMWVVEFDYPGGIKHDCMGLTSENRGFWVKQENLELINN